MISPDYTTPGDPNKTPDIYDPKNPNFVNPNDVLAMYPNDDAAKVASTRIDVVQATVLRSVQGQIVSLNNNQQGIYLTAFNNWLIGWTSLRITDKSTAPEPPNAYVVGYFTPENSAPGALQWPYPATGKDPVCAQPPILDMPKYVPPDPSTPPPGELGTKTNATVTDGFPVGYQAVRADGSVWQKCVAQTPFGTAWWWECVKSAARVS
jgi:hypothetical protein